MDQTIISLGAGLVGVWLARTIFVDRENRRLKRRQTLRETLPVTAMAMLLTGVWIIDTRPGLSAAAIAGLGVGWVAVLLLDIIGKRLLDVARAAAAVPAEEMDIPEDQQRLIRKIDDVAPDEPPAR